MPNLTGIFGPPHKETTSAPKSHIFFNLRRAETVYKISKCIMKLTNIPIYIQNIQSFHHQINLSCPKLRAQYIRKRKLKIKDKKGKS